MKMIVLAALALVATVAALPVTEERAIVKPEPIPIVSSENEMSKDGGFQYRYESGNGISQDAKGELKEVKDEDNKPVNVLTIRGSYSYPGKDGKLIAIKYVADETGFHAEGDAIPKFVV